MDTVGLLETGSVRLCGVAVILWMSIGTFSRSAAGELLAQRAIAMICLVSAVLLFVLHYMGGELWGSRIMARPMAVIAVIVAMNFLILMDIVMPFLKDILLIMVVFQDNIIFMNLI